MNAFPEYDTSKYTEFAKRNDIRPATIGFLVELVAQTARLTFTTIPRLTQSLYNSLVFLGDLDETFENDDDSMNVITDEN